MTLFGWVAGRFSQRGKALSLYHRGMAKAKRHDHQGAIDAYSATIAMSAIPPDVQAMVLYNRALVYVAEGDDQRGADDLDALLAIVEAPINVKTMARQKLARMKTRADKATP